MTLDPEKLKFLEENLVETVFKKHLLLMHLQQGRDLFISILRDKLTEEKPWILVVSYHDYDSEPETRYYLLTEQEKQQIVENCAVQKTVDRSYYSEHAQITTRIEQVQKNSGIYLGYQEIVDTTEYIISFEPSDLKQGSLISKDKILEPKELIFREKGKPVKTALYSYHYEEKGLQCQQL
jgi:hypothetical protein